MIVTVMWGWVYATRPGFHPVKLLAPIALATVVVAAWAYQANPKFTQRIDPSMAVLDFGYEGLNRAGSLRLHLWSNALTVLERHPVNGTGVRTYRYPSVNSDGTGMAYAHQLLLEVGSETGIIGLVGLLVFFVTFVRAGLGLSELGAFAWLFPVNTPTVIYSAYWSSLVWWLIAVSSVRSTSVDGTMMPVQRDGTAH